MLERQRIAMQETVGDVPQLATVALYDPTADPGPAPQLSGRRSSSTHGRWGVNLPAVGEVLARYGIDPAERLAEVLQAGRLNPSDEAKVLADLLAYTRPKLRAVEHSGKPDELSDAQIDRRLEALLARRNVG